MKNFIPVKIIIIIFSALIFSSCISIERTIKINEDGSGKELLTAYYSKDFFDFLISTATAMDSVKGKTIIDSIYNEKTFTQEIKDKYKDIEGIKLISAKTRINPDSSMNMYIEYTFKDIEKLSETFRSIENKDNSFGKTKTEISFIKKGKKYLFNYNFEKLNAADTNKSMNNTLAPFFKNQKMTFNITFPYNIVSSNAMKTNGKTLIWEFEMDKLMTDTNAIKLEAEMRK